MLCFGHLIEFKHESNPPNWTSLDHVSLLLEYTTEHTPTNAVCCIFSSRANLQSKICVNTASPKVDCLQLQWEYDSPADCM